MLGLKMSTSSKNYDGKLKICLAVLMGIFQHSVVIKANFLQYFNCLNRGVSFR